MAAKRAIAPYPLTNWANVASRFDQVAAWQPYGGPGAFNDYDSLEIGNGSNDGLTPDERQTQLSLSAPAGWTVTPTSSTSFATDATAVFGQLSQEFGIVGAGADLYSGTDAYSSIYLKGAVGVSSTIETKVVSQQNMTGYAKAGIMVRNDISGSGTTPEGVVLFESPSGASSATPPPLATSYEAESPANTIAGGAVVANCSACSGGEKVGYVGAGGTFTLNGVNVASSGTYQVTIAYLDGAGRQATISVNGGPPQTVSFTPTGSFDTVGTVTLPLQLTAGNNTIEFANPTAYAPGFDRIIVPAGPS